MSEIKVFGTMPDGSEVQRITLRSGTMKADFITYGAVLRDLRIDGTEHPLVLGFETLENYLKYSPYFGATAGRYANRIRNGKCRIDGKEVQLDPNFLDKHHLHGGRAGIGKKLWKVEDVTPQKLILSHSLADGEMGYPGAMEIKASFELGQNNDLNIGYSATTDKTTLCNLAHHSYFNLDGLPDIRNHRLWVDAANYLPVDPELIPTSEIKPVAGTDFDFSDYRSFMKGNDFFPLDHNFCLAGEKRTKRKIACLVSDASKIRMEIHSTEPGLQVYNGGKINIPVKGLEGKTMASHAGIALEPQTWPDSPNQPNFPQATLTPLQNYNQKTTYTFHQP